MAASADLCHPLRARAREGGGRDRQTRPHAFHHLLVADSAKLVGVLSDRDLLKALSPFVGQPIEREKDEQTLRRRVHQIMSRNPITASPQESIQTAALRMQEKVISCLPVMDEHDNILGIVTRTDILRWVLLPDEVPPERRSQRRQPVVPEAPIVVEPRLQLA